MAWWIGGAAAVILIGEVVMCLFFKGATQKPEPLFPEPTTMDFRRECLRRADYHRERLVACAEEFVFLHAETHQCDQEDLWDVAFDGRDYQEVLDTIEERKIARAREMN